MSHDDAKQRWLQSTGILGLLQRLTVQDSPGSRDVPLPPHPVLSNMGESAPLRLWRESARIIAMISADATSQTMIRLFAVDAHLSNLTSPFSTSCLCHACDVLCVLSLALSLWLSMPDGPSDSFSRVTQNSQHACLHRTAYSMNALCVVDKNSLYVLDMNSLYVVDMNSLYVGDMNSLYVVDMNSLYAVDMNSLYVSVSMCGMQAHSLGPLVASCCLDR